MKILVVGSGGREHPLSWKLAQSERVQTVFVAPGNGGTALDDRLVTVEITDPALLADFVVAEGVALTLVGPEAPLAAGIVNLFRSRGLKIFGPTKEAAQLESSKDFAKAFMQRHGIPTAKYQSFSDAAQAHAYVDGTLGKGRWDQEAFDGDFEKYVEDQAEDFKGSIARHLLFQIFTGRANRIEERADKMGDALDEKLERRSEAIGEGIDRLLMFLAVSAGTSARAVWNALAGEGDDGGVTDDVTVLTLHRAG